jgi:hypothetical protein
MCRAQSPGATKAPASDKTASILIRDSKSLPPEFAANVALQVAENDVSLTSRQKVKVLKGAFEEAAQGQDDVLRMPRGTNVEETTEGLHALALMTGRLDILSQQARAVHDMAGIDPKFAKAEMEIMALPRLDPPPCLANWVYFPDAYYDAVASVMSVGFSPQEISSGEREEFLRSVVSRVVSHSQLHPVTRLITASDLSGTELADVISTYVHLLDSLRGDAYSFYFAVPQLVDAFVALVARLDKQGAVVLPLITSFRGYLVANFKTASCVPFNTRDGKLPRAVQVFNDSFSSRLKAAGLSVITDEEIKSEAKDGLPAEKEPTRWKSKEMSDLTLSLQQLPDMSKEGKAAEAKYQDYLLQLDAWSNQSEPEIEFFHQKSILYMGVIGRLHASTIRTSALTNFIKFLEQYSYQQVSRADWFLYTGRLLTISTVPADRSELIDALTRSSDPVLNLYGRLELWKTAHTGKSGLPRTATNMSVKNGYR